MSFMSFGMSLPFIFLSHMISLISPIASVVLASSKKTTVPNLCFLFSTVFFWAFNMNLVISSSVVPPCTYIHEQIYAIFVKLAIKDVLQFWQTHSACRYIDNPSKLMSANIPRLSISYSSVLSSNIPQDTKLLLSDTAVNFFFFSSSSFSFSFSSSSSFFSFSSFLLLLHLFLLFLFFLFHSS